jgi:O-antigen/teichoic acid export membrane protein
VLSSLVSTAALPLFALWPYAAMAIRSVTASVVNLAYLHVRRPLRIPWRFDWRELVFVVRQGVPMHVAGYGSTTGWGVVETTLSLKMLGTAALGAWTMAFMFLEAANKVPQALVAVYTPRITETFGRTDSVRDSLRVCRKPMVWGVPAMLVMAAAGWAIVPFLVPLVIPRYVVAIPAMCVMLLNLPVLVLEMPFVVVVASGDLVAQNVVTYAGLAVFAILAFGAVHIGFGLTGVIGASVAGRLVRVMLVYAYLYRSSRQRGRPKPALEPSVAQ